MTALVPESEMVPEQRTAAICQKAASRTQLFFYFDNHDNSQGAVQTRWFVYYCLDV